MRLYTPPPADQVPQRAIWVQSGKAQNEHIMSALPPKADIRKRNCDVRFVPASKMPAASDRISDRNRQRTLASPIGAERPKTRPGLRSKPAARGVLPVR